MQMAMRYLLICSFTCTDLVLGLSLQSFLSQSAVRSIPEAQRVTTVTNLATGQGIVRPATTAPASPSQAQAASGASQTIPTSPLTTNSGPREWKIEALFEMSTTAAVFTNEFDSSVPGFALTLADRLMWLTGVPLSRFAFYLPDRTSPNADQVQFCESSNNEAKTDALTARYSSAENTTFICKLQEHKMNVSASSWTPVSLLQAAETLAFEVGVYPSSQLGGDTRPAVQIVEDVVSHATSGDEPERKLLTTGLWTYKPGKGVKFHGLFPATRAAMPGSVFSKPRETSVPLGPNPGGHGAMPPPTAPPSLRDVQKKVDEYYGTVDEAVHKATEINTATNNALRELKDSMARASAVHNAWMNTNVYQLPTDLTG